jgi:hypothetical protein
MLPHRVSLLTSALATHSDDYIFFYTLQSFVDPVVDRLDWMIYSNNVLNDCSVLSITLTQSIWSVVEDDVDIIYVLHLINY